MREKFDYITRKATIFIGILAIILTNFLPIVVYAAESNREDYVYLTDLWNTNKLLKKESSWNNVKALKINENEPGNLISLLIGGEKTYFLNGLFAHANSTLIFDISEYTNKGYDIFSAYIGVDTYASSNGNGVKFTISASKDNENYQILKTTEIFKGNTNGERVTLDVSGFNYLKLYADNNGNSASDHSVYAEAMIYNSKTYTPKESANLEWVKKVSEYEKDLNNRNIIDIVENRDLRLKLLQRTLVSKADYLVLQAWAKSNRDNEELLKWLFNDVGRLEQYILGGAPLGGSYIKSLTILSDLYREHKEDLTSAYGATFQKLMFAISLTHTQDVSSWFAGANGARVYSTPLGRYEAIKELFIGAAEGKNWTQKTHKGTTVPYTFNWEQFQDLTVEEMRWVTDTKLSDEEFLWLNWYSTITKMGETQYSQENNGSGGRANLNPYTYINYGNGGNVGRDDYYTSSPKCGVGNEFYNPDKRTSDCYDKYQLNDWPSLKTTTKAKPTLWIAFEEDGVCGTLMHVGVNLEGVFGTPAEGLGQPGHGAYIYANRVYNKEKGRYITNQWNSYNWVSNWDQSEKGERILLNWGTRDRSTVFSSTYNLIYIPLAQQAINDYENYRISELYMLISEMKVDYKDKEECYNKALEYIPYHITAWYKLLTSKVNNPGESGIDTAELSRLGQQMIRSVGNAPIAIEELGRIIRDKLGDNSKEYESARLIELNKLATTNDSKYMNVGGVNKVAQSILGKEDETKPATFSFDDNTLRLTFGDAFYYSLDYNAQDSTTDVEKDKKWTPVIGNEVDLTSRLSEISPDKDIAVYLIGVSESNVYIIDITKSDAPKNLYANDLENKVIGATDKMEWKKENTNDEWTPFDADTKFDGAQSILVRYGSHGTTLASESVSLSFEIDPEPDPTKMYVPISRLKATASSSNSKGEDVSLTVDGNPNTFWHNTWSKEANPWLQIEITDGPIELSKIEYMPRQDTGVNGRFIKTTIEVSEDGTNWTTLVENILWGNDKSTKTYILDTPTLAKYVRFKPTESVGGFASAAMVNLYENTVKDSVSVDDLYINYITSGYVYNGEEITPAVTVKDGNIELINGEHYRIEYADNINAGIGKILIHGLGIYNGTRTLEFNIAKAEQPSEIPANEIKAQLEADYLKDVPLPLNWAWLDPNTKLEAGKTIIAIAIYNGADKSNYEKVQLPIVVTKESEPKEDEPDNNNPGIGDTPENPDQPENPGTGETPENPDQPENPGTGETPENPDQ
ncbi:MAG: discoidin domain-containing protein, partial [Erysipelotrichales bacterium]|nr:discoidin domain-containing protein [Erysipelotrichales bacterium]